MLNGKAGHQPRGIDGQTPTEYVNNLQDWAQDILVRSVEVIPSLPTTIKSTSCETSQPRRMDRDNVV